jgi:ubiquinone/menaquinone biosynthesis C-methylase UbiE
MLSQAVHKSSAQEIQFIQADLTQENCGLSAAYLGTIDLITMANALFLFSKEIKKTVLENIYKLLKPDGVLILSEPTNMNTSNPTPMLVNHALHRDILRLALNAPAVISISKENRRLNETTVIQPKEELIELLRPAGFFVEKAGETYAARNTLFVCTKTIPERDAIDISDRHIVLLPFVLTLLLRLGLITLALALISFLSHR